jgi:hypothetical protein
MENTTTLTPLDFMPAEKAGEIYTFDAAQALDIHSIETLRAVQLNTYTAAKDMYSSLGYSGEELKKYTYGPVSRKVEEYLEAHKLSKDDPRYDAFKEALDDLSITSSYQSEWQKGSTADPGESGQEKAEKYYKKLVEGIDEDEGVDEDEVLIDPVVAPAVTPEQSPDPAIEAARLHLNTLRNTLATLSAKRQGKIFGTGGTKYEEAKEAYDEQVIKLGKLEKQSIIDDNEVSEVTKKAEVVAFLFEEQNNLRELSMDKLKGTAVHKFVEMMNKGNVAQRIGKGILFGAGVSLVAASAGAVIGAAGATVIVGGVTAGIISSGRFARGFARSDAKKGRGMQKLEDAGHLEDGQSVDANNSSEYFDKIHQHYSDKFETDTEKEQKKRLKSVGAGVLGIALGTGLGFAAQVMADSGVFEGLMNRGLSHPFTNNEIDAKAPDASVPGDSLSDPSEDVTPHYEGPSTESTPDIPVEPQAPESISYDPDFYVDSGEGGIGLFENMGLSEEDWYSVHQELLQNFPDDFYSMDGGANVGLSHSGQLSIEAQQFIKTKFSLA